jgi:hypothetical protein
MIRNGSGYSSGGSESFYLLPARIVRLRVGFLALEDRRRGDSSGMRPS